MRQQYSATYKAEVVKELLTEEKTLGQVASETGIHPTQLKEWRRITLTRLPEMFSRREIPDAILIARATRAGRLMYRNGVNRLR